MFHGLSTNSVTTLVSLRTWITVEETTDGDTKPPEDELLLRKTTVAYGIAEVLKRVNAPPLRWDIDNFAVRVASSASPPSRGAPPWAGVRGVAMLSPRLSVEITEPSFLRGGIDGGERGGGRHADPLAGANLETECPDAAPAAVPAADPPGAEDARCHALGVLLYELFSGLVPSPVRGRGGDPPAPREPARKKARRPDEAPAAPVRAARRPTPHAEAAAEKETTTAPGSGSAACRRAQAYFPLADLGVPASVCLLVRNLLECGEGERPNGAYDSLETASQDLHLLLLDPRCFLLDPPAAPRRLSFRAHKLYGREAEVSLITDAFCRVSSGRREAFFISGFSGSGKSRLVGSLTARVASSGAYVVTHKFNQGSREHTLLEVTAVFNDLCLLIRDRSSPQLLRKIVNCLMEVFGTDLSVLRLLLPNVEALALGELDARGLDRHGKKKEREEQMNLRSVQFTLQRFLQAVSSPEHPVVLFLDDLQWSDESVLTVIKGLLCSASCIFFVGSYRSNEVDDDHALFPFIADLCAARVPMTKLDLGGLDPADLNALVADALGTFPRLCKPLSELVHQKTRGNPFFVLEFLRSLEERRLLEYVFEERRWVWDAGRIGAMDATGNVLHLLAAKMAGLPESTRSAVKMAACFGEIKEPVIEYLSADYADLKSGLECAVAEGFMIKVGSSDFKFVHDKVREAAYSLIPSSEKNQYHYKLGASLYAKAKGSNMDDVVFPIASQINHDIDNAVNRSPEQVLDLISLNELAGTKAVDCCDYITAQAYLDIALSLLPVNHWRDGYDQSLRLFFMSAKSAYACGAMEKAQELLHTILRECHCTEDKMQAYFLLVTILIACGKGVEAIATCHEVLTQLGETIPQPLESEHAAEMVKVATKAARHVSEFGLLEMNKIDPKHCISLRFYSLMAMVAFFTKPNIFMFLSCRIVALTMRHGMCKYSIIGLCQYAAVKGSSMSVKDIKEASRVGKAAMFCLNKRFHPTEVVSQVPIIYHIYYGLVAFHTEPLQLCADMLRQSFDAGMSVGDSAIAFINSIQQIKTSFLAGEKLSSLLEKVHYNLELAEQYKNELMKTYFLIFCDTISVLKDKGNSESSIDPGSSESDVKTGAHASEALYFHRALQAFWQGYSERSQHYLAKVLQLSSATGKLSRIIAKFLQGLNAFQLLRNNDSAKLRGIAKNSLKVLKAAKSHSEWNFRNKVHLLEAEYFSNCGRHEEAKASYNAAITSARSSGFVHEQGLACELAGFYFKRYGTLVVAWDYFNQAKQCYTDWGSHLKVDSVTRQLESFQISLTAGQGTNENFQIIKG